MDIDIKKNGKLTLKDTPYFEPIDNTNISFTNMDIGTAKITFRIMKHGLPLQVSDKNVYVYAYLESDNGTRSEVIDLNFDDPINGLVSLQLDKDFLTAATNTTVKGQLYITMHKWNTVSDDFSDTVALQEFTFTVKDALVNKISGVTKIQYIRTFDQLKTEVKDRILELEKDVGRIETISNELKELFRTTTQDIEDLKNRTISELQSQIESSSAEVDNKKTEILNQLDNSTKNAINQIDNKKSEVLELISDNNLVTSDMFSEYQNDVQESLNEILEGYLSQVNGARDDFQSMLDDLEWQKYKLTNDDGSRQYVSGLNLLTAPPGQYESTNTINGPLKENGEPDTGFIESDISVSSNGRRLIMATRSSFNKTYIKTLHTNGTDTGWKELTNNQTDTGWIPFNLINGTLANDAFKNESDNGFDCAYRIITNGSVTEKRVRINARKISHLQQVAQLPKNFAQNAQFHYVRVAINSGYGLVGIFPSGSVYVYVETDKRDVWTETDYFYGEISWKE